MTLVRSGTILRQLPPALDLPLVGGGGYHAFGTAIPSPARVRTSFHLVLQLDRSALWTIDDRELLAIRAGEFAILAPGRSFRGAGGVDYPNAHAWLDLDPDATHVVRHAPFTRQELSRFAGDLRRLGTIVLCGSAGLAAACREFVACLVQAVSPATLRAAVALLLARVAEAVREHRPARPDAIVTSSLASIDAAMTDGRLAVGTLAAEAGLTATVFSRRFRSLTGWSPAAWISFRRTWLAAERITAGRESITVVAHALGFPSSQHLAACLRRHLGTTATELRSGRSHRSAIA